MPCVGYHFLGEIASVHVFFIYLFIFNWNEIIIDQENNLLWCGVTGSAHHS